MGLTKKNFYGTPEPPKVEEIKKPAFEIVTSWDDGGELDMQVADLLEKYHLKGTFYIVVDWVGTPGYLTWDQIRDLDKRGFKIGSHTVRHPMDLKALFDEDLFIEIQTSKDLLESALDHNIESFAYPRGRADDRVMAKVKEAGYLEARGTGKPGVTTIEDNFYKPGTLHIFQRPEYEEVPIFNYCKAVIDRVVKEGGYCNIFGHSIEINKNRLWPVAEEVLKYAGQFTV